MNAQNLQITQAVTSDTEVSDTVPSYDATQLTMGGTQARIVLTGQVYNLRITRAGKLILTK